MKYVFPEYKENVVLGNGKLQLNPMSYQVIYEGKEIDLTPREFEVLYLLALKPNWVMPKPNIYHSVWGIHYHDDQIPYRTVEYEETDIIMGLDIGGDDYITKPFKLAIFMSRINALLRRSDNFNHADMELSSGGITIQLLKREVYKNNEKIDLTANEYKLLCLLMENPGQVLSPEQILGKLWDCNEDYVDSNTLTVYIRRLRTKIEENPGKPERIVTVRRMGYKWDSTE